MSIKFDSLFLEKYGRTWRQVSGKSLLHIAYWYRHRARSTVVPLYDSITLTNLYTVPYTRRFISSVSTGLVDNLLARFFRDEDGRSNLQASRE